MGISFAIIVDPRGRTRCEVAAAVNGIMKISWMDEGFDYSL